MTAILNKKVLIGITGGIAAYKSADLIRRLRENGADVRAVMTHAATTFITPLTIQAVSGNPVHDNLFDLQAESAMGHIELARWADVILIAPASADIIAKLAHGRADDLLTTLCLATTAPIIVAPAMNQQMWLNQATADNVQALVKRGIKMIGPAEGSQACGETGPGRMLEPHDILTCLDAFFVPPVLAGKRVLITAGPTQEAIDPVRYLSNHSSGKMGFALAQSALAMGAQVTLVSGPVQLAAPHKARHISVNTAHEMYDAVMANVAGCDIFIGAAAVADYRCAEPATQKVAKKTPDLTLTLVRNPDILATVSALPRRPFTVGFAAQTHDLVENAKAKLVNKQLDMVAANQVGVSGLGFNSDTNALTVFWSAGELSLPKAPKTQLAHQLLLLISEHYATKNSA